MDKEATATAAAESIESGEESKYWDGERRSNPLFHSASCLLPIVPYVDVHVLAVFIPQKLLKNQTLPKPASLFSAMHAAVFRSAVSFSQWMERANETPVPGNGSRAAAPS